MKKFWFKNFVYPFVRFYWRVFRSHTKGARGIILRDESILLVKHAARDYWLLPGGGIKKTEDAFEGLKRELWEELRIPPKWILESEKLGMYFNQREEKTDTIEIFILQCADSNFVRQYELDDAKWFDLNELPSDVSPATKRRIEEYLSGMRDLERVW